MSPRPKSAGFTLIEILLIIAVLAILGVAGLSAFLDTSGTFTFLEEYKVFSGKMRMARNLAQTNAEDGADRIGVLMESVGGDVEMTVFADVGTEPLELDAGDEVVTEGEHVFVDPFGVELVGSESDGLPLYVFFNKGGEELVVKSEGVVLDGEADSAVTVRFWDEENGYERYLVFVRVSGLIEEFNELP